MDRCQICGRHPAKWMSFKAHQGFLIVRREIVFSGMFCRDHAMEAYMAARGATLKGMWFGASSLLLGAARSLWDSMRLLDLPDEVRDEPWVTHIVACPYCGQRNLAHAGSVACEKCRKVFILASCASCNAVHVLREVQPIARIRIACRICGSTTAGPIAIRNCAAMLLMRGIAEASAAVASAGGVVREAGREAFRSAVRELFRPDESTGRYLDRCFDDAATRAGVVLLATFKEFCALEYRRLVLVVSLSVAKADGVVDASEAQVLRNLAELLGFDPNGVYEGIDPGAGTGVAEPWWELFNVPAKASLDAVVFAYRKLAMQFHPDIWAQAPETQRAVAAARMKSINAAFERAKLDIRARDKREKGAASASSNPAPAEAPKPKETALAGANSHNGHEDAPAAPADVSPAAATEQRPTKEDVPDESPTVGSTKSVSRRAVYYVLGVSLVALLGLFALDSFLRSGNETSDSPTRDRVAPTLHNPQPPAITSLETAGGSPPPRDEEMVQNGPAPRSLKDDQSNNHSYARREQIPADVSTPSATTDVGLATPEAVDARREASETYVAKGIVSFRGGNLEQAIIDMSEAIKIDANYPRAYFNRGCVWTLLGEYDIAIHDFDTTIALDPNFPRAAVHRDFAIQKKRETGGRPFRGRASSSP